MDSRSPFACLLIGQPTLRRRIRLGVLAALDQRIGPRYNMPPMTGEETNSYLRHHLNLAVQSLIAAYTADKTIVGESSTHATVAEVAQIENHQCSPGSSHCLDMRLGVVGSS